MDVSLVDWNGYQVVLAEGEIVHEDADRVAAALAKADTLAHGARVLLLNSPGGMVGEALKFADRFDQLEAKVHTIVPNGAKCASACASIVFVSGDYRTVEPEGLVGQHSCSFGSIPDEQCNDLIASHARSRGVAYGSIKAFLSGASPEDMIWFSRQDVDCWGISQYPFTSESDYQEIGPCVFLIMTGVYPSAQSAWRVDFHGSGYRAFLRPAVDHLRELELGIFCDERHPGQLFLTMDITGPAEKVREVVQRAAVIAPPVIEESLPIKVEQVDRLHSRATVALPKERTLDLLEKSDAISVLLEVKPPYTTMQGSTHLGQSRDALRFVADNCIIS